MNYVLPVTGKMMSWCYILDQNLQGFRNLGGFDSGNQTEQDILLLFTFYLIHSSKNQFPKAFLLF